MQHLSAQQLLSAAKYGKYASDHYLRPSTLAVLYCVCAGLDNTAQIVSHTGQSRSSVFQALRRLTGRGRFLQGRIITGLDQPLVAFRSHPHGSSTQLQYAPTPLGLQVASNLLGLTPL